MGIFTFFLISCSYNKYLVKTQFQKASDEENYFNSDNALRSADAIAMITAFPIHKYRWPHQYRLLNSSSYFDIKDLQKIANDPNVDAVRFFLAANTDNIKANFRLPIIILQVKLKKTDIQKEKGSVFSYAQYQYLKNIGLCPPPPGGCKLTQ